MTDADDTRSEAPRSLALELVIGGKYRVESLLGEGGFARVYRARHVRIRQLEYAIKVLKQRQLNEATAIERFEREAEMSATLQSPFVVRITDFGETAAGLPYIVMEYVNGVTVHDYVQQHGRMRDIEVARVAMCVLRGLEEAHARGIVHRDLKPSNIMLLHEPSDEDVVAKVTDFGIGKVVDELSELDEGPQTTGGMVFCTPQYASPEVLMGTPNYQSDLYALGHTLAEMLDGSSPFVGLGAFEVANRQMAPELTAFGDNAHISRLWPVLRKSCAKNLEDRYRTASEMLVDVNRILDELKRSELPTARPFARLRKPPGARDVDNEKLKRDLRADFGLEPNNWRDHSSDVTRRVQDSNDKPLDPFFQAAQGNSVMESGIAPPVSENASPNAPDASILVDPGLERTEPTGRGTVPAAVAKGPGTEPGLPRSLFGDSDGPAPSMPFGDSDALPNEGEVSQLFDLATMHPPERPQRQTLTPRAPDAVAPAPPVDELAGPGPWAPTARVDRRTDAAKAVPGGIPRGAVVAAAIGGAVLAAGVTWMLVGPSRGDDGPTEIEFSGAIILDEGTATDGATTSAPIADEAAADDDAITEPQPGIDAETVPTAAVEPMTAEARAVRAARVRVFAASTGMEPPSTQPRYQWVTKPDEEPLAVDAASRMGIDAADEDPRYATVPFPVAEPQAEPEPEPEPTPGRTWRPSRPEPEPEVQATVVVPIVVDPPPDDGEGEVDDDDSRRDGRRGFRIFRPRRLD